MSKISKHEKRTRKQLRVFTKGREKKSRKKALNDKEETQSSVKAVVNS